jgi:CheY-like chemotaxis protein
MPGMVGLALLREIKSRFPNLPIMMVTAVDFDHLNGQLRQLSAAADSSAPISC